MNNQKIQAAAFCAYTAIAIIIYVLLLNSDELIPITIIVYVSMLYILGELGIFPFKGKNIIFYKKTFYAHLLLLIGMTAHLNALKAPTWYPTDNTQWIFIVWVLYGVITQARGIKAE